MSSDNSPLDPSDNSGEQIPAKVGMFDALRHRDYRWFWLGTVATFLGMQMQWPAQSWLAYELTHSPLKLGMVTGAFGIPMLVLSPIAGVIIDRVQKRDLIVIAQACNGVIMLVTAILISTHLIQFWHLLVLSVLGGITACFTQPARQAIIPEILPKNVMYNAVALFSGAQNLTRIVGPALAGVLIGIVGVDGAYYTALVFYFLAVLSLVMLPRASVITSREGKSPMRDLIEGVKYIKGHQLVLTLICMEFVIALFGMPAQQLMPVFAELFEVRAMGYGLLMAMTGIGALIGSLTIASLGNFRGKGKVLLSAGIIYGATLLIFANSPYFKDWFNIGTIALYLAFFILVLVGIGNSSYMATSTTLVMMNVKDEFRGRSMSLYGTVVSMTPIGTLMVGAIAEAKGAPFAVTICGGIMAAVMVGMAIFGRFIRSVE